MHNIYTILNNRLPYETFADNLTIYTTMHFEKYEKDGEIFAKTTNITLRINPQKTIIHLDNLFNGNVILGILMIFLCYKKYYTLFCNCMKYIMFWFSNYR